MDDTRWDHGLKVTGEGEGLAGHAGGGAVAQSGRPGRADRGAGRSAGASGKFPLIDRGVALVSMAVAIALGARTRNDIALLAHHEPVFGTQPSDTTVRLTVELADPRSSSGSWPTSANYADC